MNDFGLWFITGVEHIADLAAYDHILFICLLVLAYPIKDWRRLVILITAFTVGHSCSLAISIVKNLTLPTPFIEFLIALSILLTALFQLMSYKKPELNSGKTIYGTVVLFGLIHGLGFSFLLNA